MSLLLGLINAAPTPMRQSHMALTLIKTRDLANNTLALGNMQQSKYRGSDLTKIREAEKQYTKGDCNDASVS
jgi:hypothetical protein